ncbi:TolC family protein [Halomonas sp. Y3]|uniref:TolC family protein n=1 Tax=Halomonas sp. Y3 TaxID=2956797 RepID=UPI0020A16E87|nr:TolC family protein [Halomonas sp. Y3]
MARAGYRWIAWLGVAGLLLPGLAKATSLEEAVMAGLAIDPALRSAESEIARADQGVKVARSGYLPNVQVSVGPENSFVGDLGYEIRASQVLYDWGRVGSDIDSATAEQRRRMHDLRQVREDSALDIAELYLDMLASRQRVRAAGEHLRRIGGVQDLAEERSAAGFADRADTDRAALEVDRALEQRAIEQGSLRDLAMQYQQVVGRLPHDLASPEPLGLLAELRDIERRAILLSAAPEMLKLQEDISVARAELDGNRASFWPQLNLEGSMLRREIGGDLEDDATIGLRLRMDAFQGLSNFQRAEGSRQRVEAAEWSLRSGRRDLERQIVSLLDQDEVMAWREESLQQQLARTGELAELYRDQFQAGQRDITDLLSIAVEHFEAQRQLIDLRLNREKLSYRAASQAGVLSELILRRLEQGEQGSQPPLGELIDDIIE